MRDLTPDTSDDAIGRRLIAIRETTGMLQTAMAEALELSSQRYGTYERGRSTPPPDVIGRIWQLTGATADYILLGRLDGLPYDLAQKLKAAERRIRQAG